MKASRMFRTESWWSIRSYSGQNGRCINVIRKILSLNVHFLDTSTEAQMGKIIVQYGRPSRSCRVESVRSSSGRTIKERQFDKVQLEHGWEKVLNWECLFVNRAKGLFLYVYVDDIKLAGKTANIEPTWKILMKDVDLGEPTSFLDHVFLGCTQRVCQISKDIVENYRDMFESRISAVAKENHQPELQGSLMQKHCLLGPITWKVTQ